MTDPTKCEQSASIYDRLKNIERGGQATSGLGLWFRLRLGLADGFRLGEGRDQGQRCQGAQTSSSFS